MKHLENFIEVNGKLLYAHQELIAYDPLISEPLQRHKMEVGESNSFQEIRLGDLELEVEFSNALHYGPLRGREGTSVLCKGEVLIDRAIGSRGHGSNFITGSTRYIGADFSLLMCSGRDLRYRYSNEIFLDLSEQKDYLLLFRNYVVPELLPQLPPFISVDSISADLYLEEKDIDCLREKVWEAALFAEGNSIQVSHSRVNGYSYKGRRGRETIYQLCRSHYCLSRTKVKFKGEEIDFNVGL